MTYKFLYTGKKIGKLFFTLRKIYFKSRYFWSRSSLEVVFIVNSPTYDEHEILFDSSS